MQLEVNKYALVTQASALKSDMTYRGEVENSAHFLMLKYDWMWRRLKWSGLIIQTS